MKLDIRTDGSIILTSENTLEEFLLSHAWHKPLHGGGHTTEKGSWRTLTLEPEGLKGSVFVDGMVHPDLCGARASCADGGPCTEWPECMCGMCVQCGERKEECNCVFGFIKETERCIYCTGKGDACTCEKFPESTLKPEGNAVLCLTCGYHTNAFKCEEGNCRCPFLKSKVCLKCLLPEGSCTCLRPEWGTRG